MNKDIPIFDQRLAGLLMINKNRLVTARPDFKCKTKMVYFIDSNNKRFKEDLDFFIKYKDELYDIIENFKNKRIK